MCESLGYSLQPFWTSFTRVISKIALKSHFTTLWHWHKCHRSPLGGVARKHLEALYLVGFVLYSSVRHLPHRHNIIPASFHMVNLLTNLQRFCLDQLGGSALGQAGNWVKFRIWSCSLVTEAEHRWLYVNVARQGLAEKVSTITWTVL